MAVVPRSRAVALLVLAAVRPCEGLPSTVSGRQILAGGKPIVFKGVNWNPVPAGKTQADGIDFRGFVEADSALMAAAGINVIRTYSPIMDREVLDVLYGRKIQVLNTVYVSGKHPVSSAIEPVKKLKDHPAILMWCVGNEWNYNHLYTSEMLFDDALARVAEVTKLIKSLDQQHLVATVYGMLPPPDQINTLDHVDVWGLTAYTGISFGGLFDHWASRTGKPMFLAEFGADAYNAKAKVEDEAAQAHATTVLAKQLASNSVLSGGVASGGLIFELADEWWKDMEGMPDRQDVGGIAPGGGPYPDHVFNEEYWGIVKIDGTPREAFRAYASAVPPIGEDAHSIGSGFRLRACGASPKCSGKLGNCCPDAHGDMQECCSKEARSAIKSELEPAEEACLVEHNYDYWGQDLHILMGVGSFQDCAKKCRENDLCKSFTYGKVGYFKHLCFLKRTKMPSRTPNTCCDSGLPCREGGAKSNHSRSSPPSKNTDSESGNKHHSTTKLHTSPTSTSVRIPFMTLVPQATTPTTRSRTVTTAVPHTTKVSTTRVLTTTLSHRTTGECKFDRNHDYLGDDLANIMYVAADITCATLCSAHPLCMSFSYAKQMQGCFLKSSVKPHRRASDCCDSGLPCAQACLLEPDYDYAGDDLASIGNVESAKACAQLCFGHALCKSFTYGKGFGRDRVCFLKSSIMPGRTASGCCDSGLPCAGEEPTTTTHPPRPASVTLKLHTTVTTTTTTTDLPGIWVDAQITSHHEFVLSFTLGNPPQAMRCLVDSGSADLWIPSTRCRTCGSLNMFKAATSKTFLPEGPAAPLGTGSFSWPKSVKLRLGEGNVVGYPVRDTVRFSDLEVANQSFIIVEDSTMPQQREWDGICGIGWRQLGKVHHPLYTRLQDQKVRALYALIPKGSGKAKFVIGAVPHDDIKDETLVWVQAEAFQPGTMSKWVQRTLWVTTGGLQIHKISPVPSHFLVDTGVREALLTPPRHFNGLISSLLPLGVLGGICQFDQQSTMVVCSCEILKADLLPLQIHLGGRPFPLRAKQLFTKVTINGQEKCQLRIRPNPEASAKQGGVLEGLGGLLGGLMGNILGKKGDPQGEALGREASAKPPQVAAAANAGLSPWQPAAGAGQPQGDAGDFVQAHERRLENGWKSDLLADLLNPTGKSKEEDKKDSQHEEEKKKKADWEDMDDPLDDVWVLGGLFVEQYVTIFDFDKALLGFAEPVLSHPLSASPGAVQRLHEEVGQKSSREVLSRFPGIPVGAAATLTLLASLSFVTVALASGCRSLRSRRARHQRLPTDACWRELQMEVTDGEGELQLRLNPEEVEDALASRGLGGLRRPEH